MNSIIGNIGRSTPRRAHIFIRQWLGLFDKILYKLFGFHEGIEEKEVKLLFEKDSVQV